METISLPRLVTAGWCPCWCSVWVGSWHHRGIRMWTSMLTAESRGRRIRRPGAISISLQPLCLSIVLQQCMDFCCYLAVSLLLLLILVALFFSHSILLSESRAHFSCVSPGELRRVIGGQIEREESRAACAGLPAALGLRQWEFMGLLLSCPAVGMLCFGWLICLNVPLWSYILPSPFFHPILHHSYGTCFLIWGRLYASWPLQSLDHHLSHFSRHFQLLSELGPNNLCLIAILLTNHLSLTSLFIFRL